MSDKLKTIAYIVNQYPKVSHSFIRREIKALEAQGLNVQRFSVRSCAEELVDPDDKDELHKTKFILKQGLISLLLSLLKAFVSHPLKFLQSVVLASRLGIQSDRGLLIHLIYLMEACTLLRWVNASGVEHIHAHFGTNSTTVAMLCHTLGGPTYSFTVHGPEEFDKPLAIGLPEKIKRAAFVVAISSFGKSQLYRWCTYQDWNKVHIVRCGVDEVFLASKQTQPVPDNTQFVCVGRLGEQKGHALLIEAARFLAIKGYEFSILLVGDGPLREPIETLIQDYELQSQIKLTGWATSEEVREYIKSSRLMVLPSFAEGLPVVLMEALAMGRPVITTYIAGIPELVEDGDCGWLVPAGSAQALANAMIAALDASLPKLEKMGQEGVKRVRQNHNAAIEAKHLAQQFKHAISHNSKVL